MKWYWPKVTDLKESEKAAHEGAGACFLVAGGTAIIAGMSVWLDKPVLGMDAAARTIRKDALLGICPPLGDTRKTTTPD